jgi:hypothetical protein
LALQLDKEAVVPNFTNIFPVPLLKIRKPFLDAKLARRFVLLVAGAGFVTAAALGIEPTDTATGEARI